MPFVLVTERVRQAIQHLLSYEDIPRDLKRRLMLYEKSSSNIQIDYPTTVDSIQSQSSDSSNFQDLISIDDLHAISQMLIKKALQTESDGSSKYWLHELIRGSRLFIDPKPKKLIKRTAGLAAKLDKIRNDLNDTEYSGMANGLSGSTAYNSYDSLYNPSRYQSDGQTEFRQLSSILAAFLTILGVFAAIFFLSHIVTDDLGWRVLVSLAAAVTVAIAGIWLYCCTPRALASSIPL